jgi:hypothetical protein
MTKGVALRNLTSTNDFKEYVRKDMALKFRQWLNQNLMKNNLKEMRHCILVAVNPSYTHINLTRIAHSHTKSKISHSTIVPSPAAGVQKKSPLGIPFTGDRIAVNTYFDLEEILVESCLLKLRLICQNTPVNYQTLN